MGNASTLIERVHLLIDAPDDRVDAVVDAAERTARAHIMQGEPWLLRDDRMDEDEVADEDEDLFEQPLLWRSEAFEAERAILRSRCDMLGSRGAALAAAVSRARAIVGMDCALEGPSPLQEAMLRVVASVDPHATIVNERAQVLHPSTDPSAFPPPPPDPPKRKPRFDGGVDAELFRALCAADLLEVCATFDAEHVAAQWAAAGLDENGESLLDWLVDHPDVEEVYASANDLERALAVNW